MKDNKGVQLWVSPYKFDKPVKESEAHVSKCAWYDAKAWKVIQENMNRSKLNLFGTQHD